jgi:site-specific recombinase XerD
MNTSITISLDTRKEKKDGSYPLIYRISHKRNTIAISTGFSLKESDWDEKRKTVKASYKGLDTPARLNNLLQSKRAKLLTKITKLFETGKLDQLSAAELKDTLIETQRSGGGFLDYTQKQIELLKISGRHGSARAYHCMYQMVSNFRRKREIPLEEISGSFLRKLEADYLSRGNSLNGLAALLRSLRAVYNKAIKDKIVSADHYPFKDYQIRKTATVKRAITQDAIQSVVGLELEQAHPLFHARNYFLFSYLTFGMNFSDMAWLKVSNLSEGRVKYVRQKTKQVYDIKIMDALRPIIEYYTIGKKSDDFIFPIIKRLSPADRFKDILWARKRYNMNLKKLGAVCKITEDLTSYVSRHSAATAALFLDVPVAAISKLLGHASLSTTQTYLKSLPDDVMDAYHERIANGLT